MARLLLLIAKPRRSGVAARCWDRENTNILLFSRICLAIAISQLVGSQCPEVTNSFFRDHISRVERAGRLEQHALHLALWDVRAVFNQPWHNNELPRVDRDVAVAELHNHRALANQEKLVFVIMMVPVEFSSELDELDMHAVHFARDLRAPVVTEFSKTVSHVHERAGAGVCNWRRWSCRRCCSERPHTGRRSRPLRRQPAGRQRNPAGTLPAAQATQCTFENVYHSSRRFNRRVPQAQESERRQRTARPAAGAR